MQTKLRGSLRFILLAAVTAIPLLAQDRGDITGTVKDASGAVVPAAQITVVQRSTNASYKTTTSTAGDYTVPSLPVGDYQVKVNVQGFKAYTETNVAVNPGGETRVDVNLEVGTAQQSIEVSAQAQTIQTENARVGTNVSSTFVNSLPVQVNGTSRSPFDLASAGAGEVNSAGTFRIGGGNDTVGVTLDGTSLAGTKIGSDAGDGGAAAMNSPSVEALTEFNVVTSGFKAEFGQASGGTLSFVSKSGTNQIHGSAFEFMRNQDFDAKGFFNSVRPIYKQNNFGATVGGPVWIPKVYNGKNKTFFFGSYEGFRNRVGAGNGTYYSVPPPAFYTGNLSQFVNASGAMYQVYDPASQVENANGTYTRTPFPGNVIPQNRFDPTIVPILNYVSGIITPNRPGIVPGTSGYWSNNYFNSTGTSIAPNNRWSLKFDQNIGSKHHISFLMNRYRDAAECGPAGCPGLPFPLSSSSFGYDATQVYRGNWDWTITPTLLNRFYGGFNHYREDHGSQAVTTGSPQSEGIPNLLATGYWQTKGICLPGFDLCDNFPIISTGDFTGWGTSAPNGSDRLVFELHEDMTKVMGAHTFKWGYFLADDHYDGFGIQYGSGGVTFSSQNTDNVALGTGLAESTAGGSGFASMLLGQVGGFNMDTPRYLLAYYVTHQAFIQDDWKISSKLTVNYGFRYQLNMAPHSPSGQLSTLNFTEPNPAAGGILGATEFAGSGPGRTGSNALVGNWYGGYGPRLSLAYAINDKTVIRAAAARTFGPLSGIGQSSHQLGFAIRDTVNNQSGGLLPTFILSQGPGINLTLPDVDPGVGVGMNPPSYGKNGNDSARSDAELNYSFNIQRKITNTASVEVGYVATLASDITSNMLAFNQVPFNSLPPTLNPFTTAGRTALSSLITSQTAINAGARVPWTCGAGSASECESFTQLWGTGATVTQAYRPYPQYGTIDTIDGGGDRIGHSTYNALLVKFNKQLGNGLTIQASYSFSKILSDADTTYLSGTDYGDMYNLSLLKSIAIFDQTSAVKLTYVYELPVGHGKRYLSTGVAGAIVGGWRISGIQTYASGLPMNIGTNAPSFPIGEFSNTPTISTYQGWTLPYSGKFQPFQESYLQPQTFFPTQSSTSFGNSTRYNPDFRSWPQFNESLGLSRIFAIKERARIELRGEAFNILNRTWFGPISGATTLGNANWGKWQAQANSPRQMQLAARLSW
jgi:hypothetical protein